MADNITGEFDVVAEFSIPAVDRVLATMHRVERFPHSITFRVDDDSTPGLPVSLPTAVSAVDALGNAVVNQQQIGKPNPFPGKLGSTVPSSLIEQLVNADVLGAIAGPVRPSHLRGRAQLQLSPPSIAVDDSTGTDVTVMIDIIARYFPDPNTPPLAEFVRGELKITAPVTQAVQTNLKVLDVNIKAEQASINFTSGWSSQPLGAADLSGIDLAIRNALITSAQPSSFPIPANVNAMQLKTLFGAQSAVAALVNMVTPAGNLASFTTIFTKPADDFAFAVGVNYVKSVFQPNLAPFHWWVYDISLTSATIALQEGKIVVTVSGNAVGDKWWTKNFSFTLEQNFTLKPASLNPGDPLNTLELVPGSISGGIIGWVLNEFGSNLLTNSTQDSVRKMFAADQYFGGLFRSLFAPAGLQTINTPFKPKPPAATLTYTSADIHTSGIVVHGALAVSAWPPVYVDFQEIPPNGPANSVAIESSYSALPSWIPGGTIERYDLRSGAQLWDTETNRFILSQGPPENAPATSTPSADAVTALPGYAPLCLTVTGTRLTASGTVVEQSVSGTACGYGTFPITSGGTITEPPAVLALAQRGPSGQTVIAGHLLAQLAAAGSGAPNRIVHFADDASAGNLQFLPQAFTASKRSDAPTAILAVLTADQLTKAPYIDGVLYADNRNGAWEQVFGATITKRPLTMVVAPRGNVLWQYAGNLDSATLGSILQKILVAGPPVKLSMLRMALPLGQPAPNFLFEYSPGRQLTLGKLAGRPATLIFWKSSSQPSIDAVLHLQKASSPSAGAEPLLLAINDGDPAHVAEQVAAQNKFSATLVTDPRREISAAYGVAMWPTLVAVDAAGLASEIRYGYVPEPPGNSAATGRSSVSR